MLGFNPNNCMAVAKGVRIRMVQGPEGVKGAKGGLIRSHCDLLAIINAFNIDNYQNILLNFCLHCKLTSFNNVPCSSDVTHDIFINLKKIIGGRIFTHATRHQSD